ncbi:MAG: hypothetical protein PHZ02_17065 [Desulfocapsaceae bacterium]|nr:hypothetical protein [Desulfocapsaceae bacterium]
MAENLGKFILEMVGYARNQRTEERGEKADAGEIKSVSCSLTYCPFIILPHIVAEKE